MYIKAPWLGNITSLDRLEVSYATDDFICLATLIMALHGGGIRETSLGNHIFNFPAGTIQQECFPRTQQAHYDILFPDGFRMSHVETRQGLHSAYFTLKDIPESIPALLRNNPLLAGTTHIAIFHQHITYQTTTNQPASIETGRLLPASGVKIMAGKYPEIECTSLHILQENGILQHLIVSNQGVELISIHDIKISF